MKITLFSTRGYERDAFRAARGARDHQFFFRDEALSADTARLAAGSPCVCIFVSDVADRVALEALREAGVRLLALRSAGFNHVDLAAAEDLGITVARVPAYSPHAVAEHAVALLMTLNRKTHRAFNRVREQNFSLDGLMGFDLYGKTVGVIGAGQIGTAFARIMLGFDCRVLAFDPHPGDEARRLSIEFVELSRLWAESDVISLHCPLNPHTRHLVDVRALAAMKPGAFLINTSRGAVIDTPAVIDALKSGKLGGLGIDVYEEEGDLFFRDLSDQAIQDDVFVRLLTFPNVLITGHQGFFTREALAAIVDITLENASAFERGRVEPTNLVTAEKIVSPDAGRS